MRKLLLALMLILGYAPLASNHAASAGGSTPHSTLRFGSSGFEVTQVQFILTSFSYVLPIDGEYGTKTVKAVKHFQDASGLYADGVVGAQTWKVLDRYIAPQAPVAVPSPQVQGTGPDAARAALRAAGVDADTIEWAVGICMRESHCTLIHVFRPSTHDDSWGAWQINYWGLSARTLTIGPKESNISSWESAVDNFLKLYRAAGKCPWQAPLYCS